MSNINPVISSSPSFITPISSVVSFEQRLAGQKRKPSKAAYRRFLAESTLVKPDPLPMGGKYVGELREKWVYPSDHLAIGFSVNAEFNIMSWNVLDSHYMNWVTEKDSQGLSGSQITEENEPIPGTNITRREQHIIQLIVESLEHPHAPKGIVNLQECSGNFMKALKKALPPSYDVVLHYGNAVLYNKEEFTLTSATACPIFSNDPRTIQDLQLVRNGKEIRIINGHLPGDPHGPSREEFARYLVTTMRPDQICIAMGDINFNEIEMDRAFTNVAKTLGIANPFSRSTPYPTNVNPRMNEDPLTSKAIDHAFYYGATLQALSPDEVIRGTQPMVDLLSL